ncbi:MAG: energy-coupling factor transporter transmembrane protein EcfT [Clostridia bacterium]|nr:energy-coupling factor transporter transmembrane protein EcfT [Clostridia bacterium]
MVRDITLGQYMPGKSLIHHMDARAKIVLLIAYIVFIFLCKNFISLLIMTLFTLLVILMTKISFMKYLKSLKVILVIILFTGVLNLFYGTGEVLWQWEFLKLTTGGITNAIFVIVRISILMMVSSTLTYTTSPTDLTDAIERLLKPLTYLHVSVHEIAMMMTIALRFIPVLLEETDKIMNAQKARGADMDSGNIFQRVKALIPVLIPLFVSSFRRANDLAMAMECRCYNGGENRTRMKVLHFSYRDLIALIGCVLIFAAVIVSNHLFAAVM